MSINKVILIGRLGKDPEMKMTSRDSSMTKFRLATTEKWVEGGTKREITTWHTVVCFDRLAEACAKHLFKGSQAFIEGKLKVRQYEDAQGQKRESFEIVASRVEFLSSKTQTQQVYESGGPEVDLGPDFVADDEPIPF